MCIIEENTDKRNTKIWHYFFTFFLSFLETWSYSPGWPLVYYIVKANFQLPILLPQSPGITCPAVTLKD